jgi:beta-lactamase regulating signal transducer with metallopeptidase domain/HEAT repeat protein
MSPISLPFSGAGPLVLFLAKATLLLVSAFLATAWLRRGTAGARHLVWLAALVGVVALPVLSKIPALQLGVLPSRFGAPVEEFAVPAFAEAPVEVGVTAPAIVVAAAPIEAAVPPVPPVPPMPAIEIAIAGSAVPSNEPPAAMPLEVLAAQDLGGWSYPALGTLVKVWAVIAAALLGWLGLGALQVRRIVRTGRELSTPDWTMPLCEVADRLDLEQPPRLVMSDRIEMAFACRALSPTVVLPASAESWTDDRRRAVLFHELAHVKRHDLLGHTLGRVACALYWFHPLVWTAAKKLRAESERACDDLVLSCGAKPSEYAQHLLDMVTSVRHHGAPVMALPMARKKEFEGRMLAILDPAVRRSAPGRLQSATVIASLAVLSLTVAAVSPATATPSVDEQQFAEAAPEAVIAATTPSAPAASSVSPSPSVSPTPRATPAPAADAAPVMDGPSFGISLGNAIGKLFNSTARTAIASVGPMVQEAVEKAGRLPQPVQSNDSAKVGLLIKILETDTDAGVRKAAAWGLNDVQSERVGAALIKALKGDADASVREMAAWALAEHDTQAAASALGDALAKDKDAHVRETSAWALGSMSPVRELDVLETAASDPSAHVRESAIWALGQEGNRRAPRAVVNALTDTSEQVRMVAAWALGELEDKTVAQAIINAYQTETNNEIRAAELRTLVLIGASTPALIDMALKSSDPELRRRGVAMLAGGDGGAWPWPMPRPRPRVSP